MGGSVLARVLNSLGTTAPDIDDVEVFKNAILFVQELIEKELVMAYHDKSDGGVVQTVLEMAFAGNCGFDLNFWASDEINETVLRILFNQEAGYVFECMPEKIEQIRQVAGNYGLNDWLFDLGKTKKRKEIVVRINEIVKLQEHMPFLRDIWETTGFKLEAAKGNKKAAEAEQEVIYERPGMQFHVNYPFQRTSAKIVQAKKRPRIGILRTRGSNTDREMAKAFYLNGFEPWDINMHDLAEGKISLENMRMVAFVGGFSYGDIPGAGIGWASSILNHRKLREEFRSFLERPDTLGFYECNGAQVAPQIGVVPWPDIPWARQPRFIWGNSRKFESRFCSVNINESPCVFTQGMEGSTLGIWVANGEGKLYFPDKKILKEALNLKLFPINYADDNMQPTDVYPFNPSGGDCSLCSKDGRHLALMPHVVRSVMPWQWAYRPWGWRNRQVSPWVKFLQNAYHYLAENEDLSVEPSSDLYRIAA